MIYDQPLPEAGIDQGDIIEGCPIVSIVAYDLSKPEAAETKVNVHRIVVLTQTCDLANDKTLAANVAVCFDAQALVDQGLVKPADIKGPIRSGRIWGWYFLPAAPALTLPEMLVDFRRLHTVRLDLLRDLCRQGKRRGRVQSLYREHLTKHFADTFSRIGLPRPYETL
jgi:hypothetical protein